jgi:hypothetical protein
MKNVKLYFTQTASYYGKPMLGIVLGLMIYDFINGFYTGIKFYLQNQ